MFCLNQSCGVQPCWCMHSVQGPAVVRLAAWCQVWLAHCSCFTHISPHSPFAQPQAAKDVVLANKPIITDDTAMLEPSLLKALMEQISTLASVYHKPADTFVSRQRLAVQTVDTSAPRSFEEEELSGGASAAGAGAAGQVSQCYGGGRPCFLGCVACVGSLCGV